MRTMFRWSMRMLRENPLHTLFTVLYLVFNYALLTTVKLSMRSRVDLDNTDADGFLWYIAVLLAVVVFASTLLTMCNAFLTSMYERRRRYHMLSVSGATHRQIRGSLFGEALLINGCGALFGIAIGLAVFFVLFPQPTDAEVSTLHRAMQLLLDLTPENTTSFDSFSFYPTAQRGLFFLIPEFFFVMLAMAIAGGKNMPLRKAVRKKPRTTVRAEALPMHKLLRRMFGVGGELNRLMGKRERTRRSVVLSVFVVSITATAIMTNALLVMYHTNPNEYFFLATSGENDTFEVQTELCLRSPEFAAATNSVQVYRCYAPQVYCVVSDDDLTQAVRHASQTGVVKFRPRVYPVQGGGNLLMPQLIFVQDDDFDRYVAESGREGDVDALLLPAKTYQNKDAAWLSAGTDGTVSWTLYYYQGKERFLIADARTRAQQRADKRAEDQKKKANGSAADKEIRPKNSYVFKNAGAFLRGIQTQHLDAGKQTVRLREISEESKPAAGYWHVDRSIPALIFPERCRASMQTFLENTYIGVRLTAKPAAGDDDGKKLYNTVCSALVEHADGYIAEHPFGTGTRYNVGKEHPTMKQKAQAEAVRKASGDTREDATQKSVLNMIDQFFYKPPKPIYADLYLYEKDHLFSSASTFHNGINVIYLLYGAFFVLMLFTLATNSINVVYGHHILRRHEEAVMESCGMNERQNRAMMQYEAAWYSVRCVLYGICAFLILHLVCSLALSYGLSYENIHSDYVGAPPEWSGMVILDIARILWSMLQGNGSLLLLLFPLEGVMVFVLFLLINAEVRRRLHTDRLIQLLKKDI